MGSQIRAVYFDIDGTLWDSDEFGKKARMNACTTFGMKAGFDPNQVYRDFMGIVRGYGPNYPKHFNVFLKSYGLDNSDVEKYEALMVRAYHDTKGEGLQNYLYNGILDTLKFLRNNEILLGVISNGIGVKQWDKLWRLGLANEFDIVVISDSERVKASEQLGYDVKIGEIEKPSPWMFEKAMEYASKKLEARGEPPLQCWEIAMVGNDRNNDIIPAEKLGMIGIWLKRGRHKDDVYNEPTYAANYEIYKFKRIKSILKEIVKSPITQSIY